ncbi:MAG TPA: hypothetical protein VH234_01895 [Candidatus Saccharimonadales bacterium]|jgi:hypothetical protein|nr:hypothetical protein [Candidatus Saccharimonadales bacterium]
MLGFTHPEQAQRAQAFDALIETTSTVLQDTTVADKLAVLNTDLLSMIQNAVLPNIKNGSIRLPRAARNTDNIALLPVTTDEARENLVLSAELATPTPRRKEIILEQAGHLNCNGVDPSIMAEEFIKEMIRDRTGAPVDTDLDPTAGRYAHYNWGTITAIHPDGKKLFYIARPLILIDRALLDRPKGQQAATVVHESVHADDYNSVEIIDIGPHTRDAFDSYSELRAYHAAFVINKATGINMDKNNMTAGVERVRQLYGVDLAALLPETIPKPVINMLRKYGAI